MDFLYLFVDDFFPLRFLVVFWLTIVWLGRIPSSTTKWHSYLLIFAISFLIDDSFGDQKLRYSAAEIHG